MKTFRAIMSRCKTSRDKLINALNEQLGNLTLLHRQICGNNGFSLWSLPLCMFSIINSLLRAFMTLFWKLKNFQEQPNNMAFYVVLMLLFSVCLGKSFCKKTTYLYNHFLRVNEMCWRSRIFNKKEGLNNALKDEFYGLLHPKLTRPLGLNIFYCIYLRTYTKGLNTSSDKLQRSHPTCKYLWCIWFIYI